MQIGGKSRFSAPARYVMVIRGGGFPMTIAQQATDRVQQIRPIQFIAVGKQTRVPAPLVRVTTCGLLTLETVQELVSTDPPLARYASLTPEQQRGRGTAPALLLLKLLLSRPQRYAPRDWLMEQLCQDRELLSPARLDNLAWLLRKLICLPDYAQLRTHLVAHVQNSSGSGNGYQVAPYPLIWVDSEALAWHVEQAVRMERFGDDPLPLWERAYELAKRGSYLPDELYSDWAESRRGEVAGMLRQSVLALARLYQERHGTAGEEEALLVLRSYWQEHPREEDALRPLMELLGKRECYQEALEYYEKLRMLLEEEDGEPDTRTQDIAEYIRTKQIQRKGHAHTSPGQVVENASATALQLQPQQQDDLSHFLRNAGPMQNAMLDENLNSERRKILKEIGVGIGIASLAVLFPNSQLLTTLPERLKHYQEQVPLHWDGYFTIPGQSAITAIETVILDLQRLSPYVSISQQEVVQTLLCQYHQLAADQLRDRGRINDALEHGNLAVYLAEQLQHVELLAAALYRRGLTYFDAGQIEAASRDLNNALPFARISRPQLRGMVYMEAGRFQAHLARSEHDETEAKRLLDQTEQIVCEGDLETDAGYVKLNQGRYHIGRAAMLLALKQPQEALHELQFAEQLTPKEYQRRHAYINILRARSYFSQKQYEQAAHLALGAFQICQMVHSESNMADIARLHGELAQSPFAQTAVVQQLDFQIRQHQKGMIL
jgi:tetratricopeptide (TPR) repeat protein